MSFDRQFLQLSTYMSKDEAAAPRPIFGLDLVSRRDLSWGLRLKTGRKQNFFFKESLGTHLTTLVKTCQDQLRPDKTKLDFKIGLKKAQITENTAL